MHAGSVERVEDGEVRGVETRPRFACYADALMADHC